MKKDGKRSDRNKSDCGGKSRKRVEDYLEAIYDIQKRERRVARTTDLARALEVRPSSVTEMLSKLNKMGYIEYTPYRGAVLTEKGEKVAGRIRKYHRIFEVFFKEFLGVCEEEARKLSCEIEHHVSDDVAMKVCALIASECNACEECEFLPTKLSEAEPGEYRITVSPASLEKTGIKPGVVIRVVDRMKVEVNGVILNISNDLASLILLEKVR